MPDPSTNPALSRPRMYASLAVLGVLGVLTWFTIDGAATLHVHGYHTRLIEVADRDVPIRWVPLLLLLLFAVRVVLANARARLELKSSRRNDEAL